MAHLDYFTACDDLENVSQAFQAVRSISFDECNPEHVRSLMRVLQASLDDATTAVRAEQQRLRADGVYGEPKGFDLQLLFQGTKAV